MKSAKLCVEQDQIEKRLSQAMTSFWVDRKDECSPPFAFFRLSEGRQNPAYSTPPLTGLTDTFVFRALLKAITIALAKWLSVMQGMP